MFSSYTKSPNLSWIGHFAPMLEGLVIYDYSGILACFLLGLGSRFVTSISNAVMSLGLVYAGSITSSM